MQLSLAFFLSFLLVNVVAASVINSNSNLRISHEELCPTKDTMLVADPEDCGSYYRCYSGWAMGHTRCPGDQLWDQESLQCHDAADSSCKKPDLCGNYSGYRAVPEDCHSYVLCYNGGVFAHYTCENGQVYDSSKGCIDATENTCGN